ncbi:hypothetical protein IO99_01180 [Clostridium sulfidigenes]|uniref:WbqC-like protein n=1 Tax=Clostridium sulfidigenes TaxID=318464 RepID=A0A084JIM1_9CLOT|nr:WbqC family protein [Clostridium sulfidigenes]KEZ88805.1 hypothetical protein IO99_01180 [Clostridium sulfidigenes]
MKIGIMQPYFFPYIGYWQLINTVDKFIIYDNIEFTKKSWIRRNRILLGNTDRMITLPIKKDSDYLNINERMISQNFKMERIKLLNQIKVAYKKSPQFDIIFPLVEDCIMKENRNLFDFIYYSVKKIIDFLNIDTELIISSKINMDHSLKGKERVIEICHQLGAKEYVNPIGGIEIYDKKEFEENGIELFFLKTNAIEYHQFNNNFVPNLSIIDMLMFNDKNRVKDMLLEFKLI